MDKVLGNGHDNLRSNRGPGYLYISRGAIIIRNGMNPNLLLRAIGKIVSQFLLVDLYVITSLGERIKFQFYSVKHLLKIHHVSYLARA